jgi:hypothetical protein
MILAITQEKAKRLFLLIPWNLPDMIMRGLVLRALAAKSIMALTAPRKFIRWLAKTSNPARRARQPRKGVTRSQPTQAVVTTGNA